MPPISVLMKPSSGMCNMRCDYCFYCDEAKKREQESYGFMSEQTLKNVIRKTMLHAEGSISYVYQGGEPTLRGIDFYRTAIKLQKKYNKNKLRVENALQTNGYALNEEWCQFLKENQFLVGLSVDGTKSIHDSFRHDFEKKQTYDRVIASAKLMDCYGVDYNILTVVTCKVAENIKEIYADYKKRGWNYQQYIACLDPLGEERGNRKYALTPEAYGKFLIELFELWYFDWKKKCQPYIRQFDNYVGILMGYQPESCEQRGKCGIQTVVEADGSVYPCDFYMLDEYRMGNFNEQRLDEIDQMREKIRFVERSEMLADDCATCPYLKICKGGCQRNRQFNGQKYENYFCKSYKMFFDNCLDELEEIVQYIKRK